MATLVLDDGFQHADTTAGAAGSTTGLPTTPAVGAANGWTDFEGSKVSITADTALVVSGNFPHGGTGRPSSEGCADQRVVAYLDKYANWTGSAPGVVARYTPTASDYSSGYILRMAPGSSFQTYWMDGTGSFSNAGSGLVPASFDPTHYYALECLIVGTTLTGNWYDLGTSAPAQTGTPTPLGSPVYTIGGTDTVVAGSSTTRVGLMNLAGTAAFLRILAYNQAVTVGMAAGYAAIPGNHNGNITIPLVGTGTTWTGGGTTLTATGVAGVAKVSQVITDNTHSSITVSVPAVLPAAGASGTLTISDGTSSCTVAVGTPTLALSPTSGTPGGTVSLACTGGDTVWTVETPAGLFTVTGGTGASIGTPTVTGVGAATATLTKGSTTGTLTVTDTSTGATATFTLSTVPVNIFPNDAAVVYSPGNWNVSAGVAVTPNPGAYLRVNFTGVSCTAYFDTTTNAGTAPVISWRFVGGAGAWSTASLAASVDLTGGTPLANAEHLLELVVRTTDFNQNRYASPPASAVNFQGLKVDNATVAITPYRAPYNVVVFGDSTAEGQIVSTMDSTQVYAWNLQRYLGAEVGVVGYGGQGILNPAIGGVPNWATSWPNLYTGAARSFAGVDLVLIGEGVNDGSTPGTTQSALTTALTNLLAAVPPTCKIAHLIPLNGFQSADIKAAVAAVNSPRVKWVDCSTFLTPFGGSPPDMADSLHPTGAASSTRYPAQVAAAVKTLSLLQPAGAGTGGGRLVGGGLVR